jgi:hypothetical protein
MPKCKSQHGTEEERREELSMRPKRSCYKMLKPPKLSLISETVQSTDCSDRAAESAVDVGSIRSPKQNSQRSPLIYGQGAQEWVNKYWEEF